MALQGLLAQFLLFPLCHVMGTNGSRHFSTLRSQYSLQTIPYKMGLKSAAQEPPSETGVRSETQVPCHMAPHGLHVRCQPAGVTHRHPHLIRGRQKRQSPEAAPITEGQWPVSSADVRSVPTQFGLVRVILEKTWLEWS
jgi:hypothetical protein